ncbi:hypothetical protein [Rickettsiella endosymbiont of Miltochrista miniata]|uniref:hypothetical protein n=1 Tax=Rickettsiella endosymbiont of Miltochrista miniata TaxID=3066239 RepID=UPI00313E175A
MSKIELRNRLNSVNSSFNKLLKLKINSPEYARIGVEYENIVELALANNPLHSSNQIKLIELAARLGVIQCKMNSMELSPTNESSIQDNDAQLELLKNELVQLNKKNTVFQKEFSSRKSNTFTSQLKKAINSFEKDKRNIQAAYSYNFACHILEATTSPQLVKKSINYLEISSDLYAKNDMQKAKNETAIKIAKTKEALMQLQLKCSNVSLERIKPKNQAVQIPSVTLPSHNHPKTEHFSVTIANTSDQSTSTSPLIAPMEKEVHTPIIPIESTLTSTAKNTSYEQVVMKQSAIPENMNKILDTPSNKFAKTSNKRRRPPLTNSSGSRMDSLILFTKSNTELLNLETRIFNEITASLERAEFLSDNYFYLQLIHNVTRCIQPRSNPDQLAQLRLAEIVLYFSKSSEILENKQRILNNEHSINSVYKDYFPLEKRLKPETLREKFQAEDGLKSLFLAEIKTYYNNQKKSEPNNKSLKKFLTEIQAVIENSIKLAHTEVSHIEAAITEGTIEIISNHISNLPIESAHHCLTNILQILKKFYMSSDQQDWLEEKGIPIKPENSQYIDFLSKLLELVPAPTLKGERLREDPPLIFFKPANNMLTKEIFLDRLKNHLLMLKRDYVTSNNKYSAICDRLTQLITTQIDQSVLDQQPIWKPYLP